MIKRNVKVKDLLPGDLILWEGDPTLVIAVTKPAVHPENSSWWTDVEIVYMSEFQGIQISRWDALSVMDIVRHT